MFKDAYFLMDLFEDAGFETRIAGGAVRDMLLGETPKDIDLATVATPDQMVEILKQNRINYIDSPNARKHGTITAIVNHTPFEITTLRIDKMTDGRHAEVEFTDDWRLDSQRRDFTINSMFMDKDNNIYDYFGGQDDIHWKMIRFVANPEKRIQEDYLRIMRFFRFVARFNSVDPSIYIYGTPEHFSRSYINCVNNAAGLQQIAKERIWSELCKTFEYKTKSAEDVINIMANSGVLDKIQPLAPVCGVPSTIGIAHYNSPAAYYAGITSPQWVKTMPLECNDMRLMDKFIRLNKEKYLYPYTFANLLKAIVTEGYDDIKEYLLYCNYVEAYDDLMKIGDIGTFPVSGKDLLEMGIPAGKQMGEILNKLKIVWAESIFTIKKDKLLAKVPDLI